MWTIFPPWCGRFFCLLHFRMDLFSVAVFSVDVISVDLFSYNFAVRQVGILILIHRLAIASPSIQTTNRPWKGAWLRHVTHFKFGRHHNTFTARRYAVYAVVVCLSVCLTHNGEFAIILHKIGCHGNVPWDIDKRGPYRSIRPKSFHST